MSATIRPISLHTPKPAPGALTLEVRWEISPRALLASAPAAALLNGQAPRLAATALVWHIESGTARAELALQLSDSSRHSIPLTGAVPVALIAHAGLTHIDAPGLLHLTLRDESILFARTTLLAEALSLPGGVYEVPSLTRPG